MLPDQPLREYPWSSYPLFPKEPSTRPAWLRVDRLLGEWAIPQDSPAGREQFALCMETLRRAEAEPDYEPTGWYHGTDAFRQELLAQVEQLAKPTHREIEVQESAQAKAERILETELRSANWTAQDLLASRKGDCRKVRIAARLRAETTMTLAWIAQRLHMGTAGHLACLLYRLNHKPQPSENNLF